MLACLLLLRVRAQWSKRVPFHVFKPPWYLYVTRLKLFVIKWRPPKITIQRWGYCGKSRQLVNGFDCWQFVVNASRISQSYFCVVRPTHISLALAVRAVSLFSSRAAAFAARRSLTHMANWRKKRDCSQSIRSKNLLKLSRGASFYASLCIRCVYLSFYWNK